MTNIIKFPRGDAPKAMPAPVPVNSARSTNGFNARGKALLAGLVRFVWVATVLVWPVLKWIVSIEVFFQFVRMIYHWDTPGVYAGWTFLVHFSVLTALTYFVSLYKPKGI
nr:KleE protein [uncultured bacterium]